MFIWPGLKDLLFICHHWRRWHNRSSVHQKHQNQDVLFYWRNKRRRGIKSHLQQHEAMIFKYQRRKSKCCWGHFSSKLAVKVAVVYHGIFNLSILPSLSLGSFSKTKALTYFHHIELHHHKDRQQFKYPSALVSVSSLTTYNIKFWEFFVMLPVNWICGEI